MFKLIVLAAFVAVVTAKPEHLFSPVISSLVQEKTIESHGNSIVHPAPVVDTEPIVPYVPIITTTYAQPAKQILYDSAPTTLVAEKTVSNHGHSIVHNAQPLVHAVHAAYVAPTYYV